MLSPKLDDYSDVISEGWKELISIWKADENTEGWSLFNDKNDVVIHKKQASAATNGVEVYKGKTRMNIPLPYLLNYLKEVKYKPEFDDMFEYGETVEELGYGAKIVHLVYKSMFPVTGRDFCIITDPRHVKDKVYGNMVKSVTHEKVPDMKDKVRAEIVISGYIFEVISENPPVVDVIQAVCTNMHGSLPQMIVNKVVSEMPLTLAVVRKKVEERYAKNDPDKGSGKEFFDLHHKQPSIL